MTQAEMRQWLERMLPELRDRYPRSSFRLGVSHEKKIGIWWWSYMYNGERWDPENEETLNLALWVSGTRLREGFHIYGDTLKDIEATLRGKWEEVLTDETP